MSGTEKLETMEENGQEGGGCCRGRSPFWGLAIVFVSLIVGYSIQLQGLWIQCQQSERTDAALAQLLPQAKAVGAKLQRVGEELIQMSATSTPARQIVEEFNIQASK